MKNIILFLFLLFAIGANAQINFNTLPSISTVTPTTPLPTVNTGGNWRKMTADLMRAFIMPRPVTRVSPSNRYVLGYINGSDSLSYIPGGIMSQLPLGNVTIAGSTSQFTITGLAGINFVNSSAGSGWVNRVQTSQSTTNFLTFKSGQTVAIGTDTTNGASLRWNTTGIYAKADSMFITPENLDSISTGEVLTVVGKISNRAYVKFRPGGSGSPTGAAGGDLTGTYPNPTIGNDKVISANVLDGTLVNADLASQTIDSNKIKNRAITTVKIADDAITSPKIATGAVGSDELASSGVTAGSYTAANITVDADGRVTSAANGSGGSGASIIYDNYRLPGIYEAIPAKGLLANESVTNYGFASVDPTYYKFSTSALGTSSTEYGGWLANGTSGDSIGVSAPFGVITGDSQAEGHPAVHGRLHPGGVATFNRTLQDVAGNPSYHLRQLTKMRWFNHGIGGQTSDQVWARWSRDVLGNTYDVGDGRGSKTLNRKPNFVIVIAGINDFYVYTTRSWTSTAANLENMAKSARDNGIVAVFLNCPGDEIITMNQARKVDSLNTWMKSGALQAFGASVVDYNAWWRDSTYNDNAHGNSLLADDIHPTSVGYDSLMNYVFRAAKLPVLTGVRFRNEISPAGFTGYSRPSSINIQGVAHTIADEDDIVAFSTPLAWDSVSIKINSSTNVTGTSYSGFSHIEWIYANDTTGLATKRPELYAAYQGANSSLFSVSSGVISPTTTSNRLAVGTASAGATTTVLTVQGTTTDATVHTRMQSSAGANPIVFTNNGRIGINRTGASYNLHVSGTASIDASTSDYWFFNGSVSEMFGSAPRLRFQSTSFNTGGTGRTDMDMSFNGTEFNINPVSGTAGGNFKYIVKNKAADFKFIVDLANNKMGLGNITSPAAGIDFSTITDAIYLPAGTTAQRSGTGGVYPIRYNTDIADFEVSNASSTWHILPRILKGSATLDFGSTAANSETDLTITVTGAADGDVVSLGVPNASAITGTFFAWVSATNTVTVRFHNGSGGSVDPASGTFKVTVTK